MGEVIKFQDYIKSYYLEEIKINFKIKKYIQTLEDKTSDKYGLLTKKINRYISNQNLADLFYKIRQSEESYYKLADNDYAYESNEIYHDELLNTFLSLRYLKTLLEQNNDTEMVASLYIAIENQIVYLKTLYQFYVQYLRDTKTNNYSGSGKTRQSEEKLYTIALGTDYLINILNSKIKQKKSQI